MSSREKRLRRGPDGTVEISTTDLRNHLKDVVNKALDLASENPISEALAEAMQEHGDTDLHAGFVPEKHGTPVGFDDGFRVVLLAVPLPDAEDDEDAGILTLGSNDTEDNESDGTEDNESDGTEDNES